jgi:hypothetical protein
MPDVFVSPDDQIHQGTPSPLPANAPVTESQKSSLEGHNHNLFTAFSLYPDNVDFETREDKEKIILMLRSHPITNVKWILMTFILLTGPMLLGLFKVYSLLPTLPTGFPLVISLAWYLVTAAYAIENFLDWYFDVYFVTNQRVIDVDFFNLIDKRVSDAEIGRIQDVSYSTSGVAGTMLNYGSVFIQTAAEVSEFEFEAVPNPDKVAKILDDLMAKNKINV